MCEAGPFPKGPRPRRRHIRVRTMLLLIAALGPLFAWPGRWAFRRFERSRAFSAVRSHGGIVHQGDGGVGLILRDPDDVAKLAALNEGISLDLATSGIDDVGLARLRPSADHLVFLRLSDCPITDEGLANLADATHLRVLLLDGTGITDAGLAHLTNLTELEDLILQETAVTDAGLVHLRTLGKLRQIIFWKTGVSDDGARMLGRLPNLRLIVLPSDNAAGARPSGLRPGITVVRQKVVFPKS